MKIGFALRALTLAGMLLGLSGSSCRAEDWFYVLIFGSQSQPKQLRYTHTWATFVHAQGEGRNADNYHIESHTISWLPASGQVRVWSPTPEPGVNLGLEQTLQAVYAQDQHVVLWGPFLITREIWNRSVAIAEIARNGQAQYRAISGNMNNFLISDCIHAVAAVDPEFGRNHYPLIRIGIPASRFISREVMVRSLNRGVNQANNDNSWVIERLGLGRYPMEIVPPRVIPPQRCFLCVSGP